MLVRMKWAIPELDCKVGHEEKVLKTSTQDLILRILSSTERHEIFE